MNAPTLVVAPSWVGDAILSEPLLAFLRAEAPGAGLDVLAAPWCAPVYRRITGVGRVIENSVGHGEVRVRERRRIAEGLRESRYGRVFILPNSFKSALIPWLAGIPQRVGYAGEGRRLLLTDARRRDRCLDSLLVDRFVALARPEGAPATGVTPAPMLHPDRDEAAAAIAALGLELAQPVAAFCPGAEYGPAKRWPSEHFIELGRRLMAEGYAIWLFGSKNDAPACAPIAAALPGAQDLSGRTDLGTAIDLLERATLVVSNDSGLMHAAAALQRPLVALFGSSSPRYTPPLSPLARIARIEIECSPCFQRECPLGHFRCMRELAPDVVYDLARGSTTRAG